MEAKETCSWSGTLSREFITFIRNQTDQIKQGGWPVLTRKLREFLKMLLFLPLTLPAVLLIRALRPLVLIRFSPFDSERIGNFAAFTEMYLCRRDANVDSHRIVDVFYHRTPVCNIQLKKMWDRTLTVSRVARPIDILNRALPKGEIHQIPPRQFLDRDVEGLLPRMPIHLSFTPEEERLGREKLMSMGVPDGVPFVCFHARDSAYLEEAFPGQDMSFHDYRDSNINNHIPAAEEMTRRGYFAVRMGSAVKEPLRTTNPMIIDYATKHRADFMDIYLCAKCCFYIGDGGGLTRVVSSFRKPLASVNIIPIDLITTQGPNDLSILKRIFSHKENRILTFRELFKYGFNHFDRMEPYEQNGLEPIENTPEEIVALAVEMDERLKGTWQTTQEDEELQQRFWELFKPSNPALHGLIESRIGADFLRRNRELLD